MKVISKMKDATFVDDSLGYKKFQKIPGKNNKKKQTNKNNNSQ